MPIESIKQRKSVVHFLPFPDLKSFFLTKSSIMKLWHLAVALCKAGLQYGPLGEELGQATHPQKKRWCLFPQALRVHDLQRHKWAGKPEDSWSTWE